MSTDSIVEWLRRRLAHSGARGFVFGLSGGIDSALVARLCQLAAPANVVGVCVAYNGSVSGSCMFQNNPSLASVVQSGNSDAYIYFSWDANNQCTMIQVDNGSYAEPKK